MRILQEIMRNKVEKIALGQMVVFTDAELDYLDSLDHDRIFYVSAPNPDQLGTLDRWVVAKPDHPFMVEHRKSMGVE